MSAPLKILVLEDSEADFLLLKTHLARQGVAAEYRRISTPAETQAALAEGGWDIVLSDYNLPGVDIHQVLDELQARHPDLPVILISGSIGEERAVEMLRRGVCDFILKDNLARLTPAIHRSRQQVAQRRARQEAEAALRASRVAALNMMEDAVEARRQSERVNLDLQQEMAERRRAGEALRESEARFQRMTACIDDVLYGVDGATGEFQYVSPAFERLFGYTPGDVARMGGREAFLAAVIQDGLFDLQRQTFHGLSDTDASPRRWESWWRCKSGELRCIEDRWIPIFEDGRLSTTFGVLRDITERRRAQASLERSEAEFRAMFQTASIGMAQADPRDGRFLRVNQKLCSITGYSEAELLERRVRDITHPDDGDADMDLFHRVVRGELPEYRIEKRYIRKDGGIAWVSINMTVIRDASGKALRTMATIEDISGRKREEQERDTTVRLLALLNASGDLHDLLGRVTGLLRDVFGVEAVGIRLRDGDDFPYFETRGFPAEFVRAENHLCPVGPDGKPLRDAGGRPVLDCMCGNVLRGRFDPAKPFFTARGSFWANDTTRLLATTTDADRQTRTRNRCNGEGYESVALVALRAGGRTFGLLQFNDHRRNAFTPEGIALIERLADSIAIGIAHRRGQEQLRSSEERYRRLFEGMSDPVYVLRAADDGTPGAFIEVNDAVCRQLGYTREEMLSKSPFDIDPDLTADLGRDLVGQVVRNGRDVFETAHCTRDGRRIPVEISSHMFEMGGEKLILCITRDLSERRRLEAQVRQAQKMEAIGQLAGGVAHDFNNILTTTLLQVELLQDNPSLDPETRTGLHELNEQARRAAALTRQLLLFSRQSAIQLAPLDLNEVAGNLLKMLRRTLGEDIDLRFHGRSVLPRVKADIGMMEQVLMNLAVNARDAMPGGGHLTIATDSVDVDEAHTREHPDARAGRFVCLAVTDTGCGMDKATLQRIFEPFFTTKEVGKGTGLGLATVYGIVQQHRGWIEVDSVVGEGTSFRVLLPAIEGSGDTEVSDVEPPAPPPGGTETILLVEDEADVRAATASYLRGRGYTVIEAANGNQARALWARHADTIDLVYSDMVMPGGVSGLDLAIDLRRARPSLRIIISSGYSRDLSRPGAPETPHLVFLPKPSPPAEMARTVRRCLDAPPPG